MFATISERDKALARTVSDPTVSRASIEQYRSLAFTLENAEPRGAHRVAVVTSALPGEGKTLTVVNLALTLSDSFRKRVLIVDGDLRRCGLYETLTAAADEHLEPATDVPPGITESGMLFSRVTRTLSVLGAPASASIDDPVKTLKSPSVQAVFDWARANFDWVLVDSPPAALVPDANILAQMADGVLFVVWAATTPFEAADRAMAQIGKERILGVVMNRVPEDSPDRVDRYYGNYSTRYPV